MIYKSDSLYRSRAATWTRRRRAAAAALRFLLTLVCFTVAALISGGVAFLLLIGMDDLGWKVYLSAFLTVALATHVGVSTGRYEPAPGDPGEHHPDPNLPPAVPGFHDDLERLWQAPAYVPSTQHVIRPAVLPQRAPHDEDLR